MTDQVEYLSQDFDFLGTLQTKLRGLKGISTLTYELIQNADDVKDESGNPAATRISIRVNDDALVVENDGVFRERDFERMRKIAFGGKREEEDTTGAFGIGFISVYQITDAPEIISSGRHWILHPEMPNDKRIAQRRVATEYTTFRLPWAFEESQIRFSLRLEKVSPGQLDDFTLQMEKAIRFAAIFLKHLTILELFRNDRLVVRIERVIDGDRLVLDDGQDCTEWQILRSDFSTQADRLRKQHSYLIEQKKSAAVSLAIPGSLIENGHLFAFLPTEMSIPLPFHINADFYTNEDRKQILFGQDFQAAWNRAAITAAAEIIVSQFDPICGLFSAVDLWGFVQKIQACSQTAGLDPVFRLFWDYLKPVLPDRSIVLTSTEAIVQPAQARLLDREAEHAAVGVFEKIGLRVVHSDLRSFYSLLMELGTSRLSLLDIAQKLQDAGLVQTMPLNKAPAGLKDRTQWVVLYGAINSIWQQRASRQDQESARSKFAQLAVAFGDDGALWPPAQLYTADAETRQLFSGRHWFQPLGSANTPIPNDLVNPFSVQNALQYFEAISADELNTHWLEGRLNLERIYRWFEAHKSEVTTYGHGNVDRLRRLTIWPAGGRLRALSSLYLAGGFDDPLQMANLVDVDALGGKREFLHELGVKDLDFTTYAQDLIPAAFSESNGVSVDQKRQLVVLVAVRLGEIRDRQNLRSILASLPLVECQDGKFEVAGKVYFPSDMMKILGAEVDLAVIPSQHSESVQALYEWLGVVIDPRQQDVIHRIRELSLNPPTPETLQAIVMIFQYLASRWVSWDETRQNTYGELKRLRWLPGTRDDAQWHSPDTLYADYQDYLFKSQGNFLSFPRQMQRDAGKFMEFLGIHQNPLPIHIVRHILYCSEHGEKVNEQVYAALSYEKNMDDPAIEQLKGKPCLLFEIDGQIRYVRPDQVYWGEHPFGPFRYRLGPEMGKYHALFERLGVRDCPEMDDYVRVLLDISNQYAPSNLTLDDTASQVVLQCWTAFSNALQAETLTPAQLKERLTSAKTIPGPQGILVQPERLFFEDRAGLAPKFDKLLHNDVIQRVDGAWFAMEQLGVRALSQAIQIELAVCEGSVEDALLPALIRERRIVLQRILNAERTRDWEALRPEMLETLKCQRADELEMVMSIEAFRQKYKTDPEPVRALFFDHTLYVVYQKPGEISWSAVGRELATAIKPIGEIGSLAGGIKDVLSAADLASARISLDELGYPPLQGMDEREIEPGKVIEQMGEGQGSTDPLDEILGGGSTGRTPIPEQPEEGGSGGGTGSSPDGGTHPPRRREKKSRLISYVYPDGTMADPNDVPSDSGHKKKIEKAATQRVLEFEALYHRQVQDMNEIQENHPGYDLESTDENGTVRYIEVKGISGTWDSRSPAMMTHTEFTAARDKKDQYWLYIVELAESDEYAIHRIQNPANRAHYYLFDEGWEGVEEK